VEEGPKARRVLILLVAGEVIAVVALHRLGGVDGFAIPRHDFGRWLQQSTSEEVLLPGVRLVALVAAWWLLGSTLLYVARLHGAARALGWATLPAVRRWVDRAAAVSIVAATALGTGRPAAADPPPTTSPASAPVVVDVDHRDPASVPSRPPSGVRTGQAVDSPPAPTVQPTGTLSPPPTTTPLVPPTAPPPVVTTTPAEPVAPADPPPAPAAGTTHTVTGGEHLWSIAATRVASASGRASADLSPADIAPYWLRVVELNRQRLRSGNPNLVYPGEVVELPPL
jgi:hypothetical protein